MKKELIFSLTSPYRDDYRVTGYRFGGGEKACCIVGALRGNELQQMYVASRLIKRLTELEKDGCIAKDKEILVIPSAMNYGMNISKRFWCMDNTDINRMFPGNAQGETSERIAAGIFDRIRHYANGIHLSSFYIEGVFVPHVRMMRNDKGNCTQAEKFGLPYAVWRTPLIMERSTLNYCWQTGGTAAYSLYTTATECIDEPSAELGVEAILRFLNEIGAIICHVPEGATTTVVNEDDMVSVLSSAAGFFRGVRQTGDSVKSGELLAQIIHPYEGEVIGELLAPCDGAVFFVHTAPLIMENNIAFKLIKE